MIRKAPDFLLYGSVFIAICTVALALETSLLLNISFNPPGFYSFLFGATLVQYNLHYMTKKVAISGSARFAWSVRNQKTHRVLLVIGLILILYSLSVFRLRHYYILLSLGAIATLYSFPVLPFGKKRRLKDYGILKILTLSLLWTLVTVWFPANEKGYDPLLYWFVFAKRFVFMFVLCLLFDMRDASVDAAHGIRTIPVRVGAEGSYKIAYGALALFLALCLAQYFYLPRLGFLLAMVLSGAATGVVIQATRDHHTDVIYLAGIDGMMILQAILVFLLGLNL